MLLAQPSQLRLCSVRLRRLRRGRCCRRGRTAIQFIEDGFFERLRLGGARPPTFDLAILSDQELLKVPLDTLHAQQARLLLLHPLVHGLRLVAIDIRLLQHREADAIVDLAEALDLVVGARVLAAELIAGKA
jgi:hypothetical protein